jgi:hypothetical protein
MKGAARALRCFLNTDVGLDHVGVLRQIRAFEGVDHGVEGVASSSVCPHAAHHMSARSQP